MTAIISRMACLWIWANFIATYFEPTKYTEFISLNAATLCGIECHPKIESIFAISTHSEERTEKIPSQLYLNGIVIASLSAASGTRWILTACRFKICSPKSHQDKPFSPINRNTHTRDKLTRLPIAQHTHFHIWNFTSELNDIWKMKLPNIDRQSDANAMLFGLFVTFAHPITDMRTLCVPLDYVASR